MHDEFHFGGVLILNCLDCSPCTLLGPTKGSKVWIKYMIISSCFKIFVNALVLMQPCDMIIIYFVTKRSLSFTLGYLKKILKIFLYNDIFFYSVQIFCKWFQKDDFLWLLLLMWTKWPIDLLFSYKVLALLFWVCFYTWEVVLIISFCQCFRPTAKRI